MTQAITFKLPDTLGKTILAFTPEVTHAQVSKTFAAWTKKAQELEWQALGSNPLLVKQVAAITDPVPLCFKKLLNEQREAFLTSTAYDAFVAAQPAFAGSYSRARFEQGAGFLAADAQEQDRNLERAWRGQPVRPGELVRGIAWQLGFNPALPGMPQTATEIRAYLDHPAHQAAINRVSQLNLYDLGLTGIPPEVERFPMVDGLKLSMNRIRNVPKEILNLRNLKQLELHENRFDRIPEILMRYNGITYLHNNPITRLSEEIYDLSFTWQNWIGRPFSDVADSYTGIGYLFCLFYFAESYYGNGYYMFSKHDLKEIPFALWLREKLGVPNVTNLMRQYLNAIDWLPAVLNCIVLLGGVTISLIIGPFLWLLHQFLSLVVVPVVTKVRELLGYGRMIRLD